MTQADLLFENGTILTMDPARPRAGALAVIGERIAAVGSASELSGLVGPRTRRFDLGGRTLVPGFDDAHVHVWKVGQLLTGMVDLRGVGSLGELAATLREAASALPPGEWLQGRGFNEARLSEGRMPDRHDLDRACPDRPVYLTRTCGHIAVASSRALRQAGVDSNTAAPPGGAVIRGADGQPTGELHETAMGLVGALIPPPTDAGYEAMILASLAASLAAGVTSSTDAGVPPGLLRVYRALDAAGRLPARVNVMALRRPVGGMETFPLPERHVSDRLRIDSIKLLSDGGLSGATAALRVPYRHCPDHGLVRLEAEEIVELCRDAGRAGLRLGIHAIGDAAIDTVLDAYERLGAALEGIAPRIEHFGLPDRHQLERARRLGVVAVPQTIFVEELGQNFRRYLPDALLPRAYPVRSMLAAGLTVALSSDAPVVRDGRPLSGLAAAVLRRDDTGHPIAPEEAITAEQALHCYTHGGAAASGDLANRGSLAAGKWADMVVLSADPTTVPAGMLKEIRVEATLVAGKVVHGTMP